MLRYGFGLLLTGALLAQSTLPITGREVPELVAYENALRPILQRWSIPGAALAIADNGRLVYARGFGLADREAGIPVQPASIFRLASISKTFTGMAILRLVQDGRLSLDAKFVDVIPNLAPPPGVTLDPRVRDITIRQLLQHTGGWDRDIADDHVLQFTAAARALSVDRTRLTPTDMVRYSLGQRLDFAPGTRYSYSQTGYQILGRVIERLTGKPYEEAVRELTLAPAGVTAPKIGKSLPSQREPDEVKYYDYPGAPLVTVPVVPGMVGPAPRPYANRWMELNEAYGGWIGTAPDLLKWILSLEGRRGPAQLNSTSLASIIARPSVTPSGEYVGLTWRITPISGGQHWWHSGGASGTRNLLTRRQNNRNWVVLMNSRPENEDQIISDLFVAMAAAEQQVRTWPTHDLFADFDRPRLATGAETLTFTHSQGSTAPAAQTLPVTSSAASLTFTVAAPTVPWLKVDRLSGTTPANLQVSVEPGGLTVGEQTATLLVNAPASANGQRAVTVTLRVTAPPLLTNLRNAASRATVTAAAPASRLVLEFAGLAPDAEAAGRLPVLLNDSAGQERPVSIVRASADWVEVLVPGEAALGEGTISVATAAGVLLRSPLRVEAVTPALFTANGTGAGAPAGRVLRRGADDTVTVTPLAECNEAGECPPSAIDLSDEAVTVELELDATGLRLQTDLTGLTARIGDEPAEVVSLAASDAAPGVDLVRVKVARSLAGRGEVDVVIAAAERSTNAVKILLR